MSALPHLKLISFNLCPFVQRSVITLEEKGIPYEIEYIDLMNKPEWFLKVSPLGKVPVLIVDGETALFESAAINEYLDEITPGQLHPEAPLERARHRAWMQVASELIGAGYRLMIAKDEGAAQAAAKAARTLLERFEGAIGAGPFFGGEALSLVDTATGPALQRLVWSQRFRDFGLFDGLPKVTRLRDTLLTRPSVVGSTVANIEGIFAEYLAGRGTPTRKTDPAWLWTQKAA